MICNRKRVGQGQPWRIKRFYYSSPVLSAQRLVFWRFDLFLGSVRVYRAGGGMGVLRLGHSTSSSHAVRSCARRTLAAMGFNAHTRQARVTSIGSFRPI